MQIWCTCRRNQTAEFSEEPIVRSTPIRLVLVLLAALCGLALLGAAPATADVDCANLPSQGAAQSYFDGRSGDADGLDADADGRACEASDPVDLGSWTLFGLVGLLLGALVVNGVLARRKGHQPEGSRTPVPHRQPAPHVALQRTGDALETTARSRTSLATADDSLEGLIRALRRVPRTKRMPLVELYAVAHHTASQDVLTAVADQATELELRRWARPGRDSPSRRT